MADLKIDNLEFAVTVDGDRRVIRDATIVISDGSITGVDKTATLATTAADRVIDGSRRVAIPGMLNGHLHISYAHAVRGIFPDDVEDRLAQVFLMQTAMTAEEEYATTLLGLTEMVMTGTTTLVDPGTTRFPDAVMAAYEAVGCRVMTGEHVTDRQNPVNLPVYETGEAIARLEASVGALHGRLDGRMTAWTMPFSMQVCSPGLLVAAKAIADRHGTSMTLHHGGAMGRPGPTPTRELADLGVLGPNVVLSHCMGLADEEIAILADTGASVVMCPSTVVKSAGGIATHGRLPELVEAGVPVALGTDSANSSNFIDLVRTMHLAATLYKDARGDTSLLQPETVLELATRTGATALGAGDALGAIEVGRQADLVLFDTGRPHWRALTDPVRNLVYSATGDSVDTVIIDGEVKVEGGKPTFVGDLWALIDEVERAGARIRAETGIAHPSEWPPV
ncbi:MAG: amidohydrolase family protein [Actinomycetia bacterium]|nr:amidohydrolase family protein [Actinomycetes bacterium]